ncbi:MAG: hypothetical protein HQL37_06815 [Alphaproteobacteria bacterium]|nr:hypothetical protein [Alphaproteobacteria bacterium]
MAKKAEVGYGRPPVETRFQKGTSGNPKGRPKGSCNGSLQLALMKELDRPMDLTENGRKVKITKKEVLAKSLIANAIKGDTKAFQMIMTLAGEVSSDQDTASSEAEAPDDLAILAAWEQRKAQRTRGGGDE